MTQFKEKSRRGQESVSVGLFDYPVLMASDILLYDTDEVPVGDDQRQHVELTRDIAHALQPPVRRRVHDPEGDLPAVRRAGHGPAEPDPEDVEVGGRHRRARSACSKTPKAITKKIKSAVTDSDTAGAPRPRRQARRLEPHRDPRAPSPARRIADVEKEFGDGGYGTFKAAVADAVVEYLRPVQERYAELAADPAEVDRLLAVGADAATAIADPVLARATQGRRAPPARHPLGHSAARSASTIISTSAAKLVRGVHPSARGRLGRVADEQVDLGRAVEALVLHHVVVPVETDATERDLAQLADRVRLAARHDVVAGLVELQHLPHRLDVVAREAPVAARRRGCRGAARCRGRA